MCFSAQASFIVGSTLLPAGAYCLWSAAVKRPSYLGFAAVPVFFGIQQISEGFVWLGLQAQDEYQTKSAALVFLFFAQAFWPLWFPVLTTVMEPEAPRRWVLASLSVLAFSWVWVLYYPLLREPHLLIVGQEHHSIQYEYGHLAIYEHVPRWLLRVLYLLCVAVPLLITSQKWGRIPGLVLGASALFSAIVFNYAFVSVWCFFAAVMAGYCCWVLYQLPRPTEEAAPALRRERATSMVDN